VLASKHAYAGCKRVAPMPYAVIMKEIDKLVVQKVVTMHQRKSFFAGRWVRCWLAAHKRPKKADGVVQQV
jgi:hypothetical protein